MASRNGARCCGTTCGTWLQWAPLWVCAPCFEHPCASSHALSVHLGMQGLARRLVKTGMATYTPHALQISAPAMHHCVLPVDKAPWQCTLDAQLARGLCSQHIHVMILFSHMCFRSAACYT